MRQIQSYEENYNFLDKAFEILVQRLIHKSLIKIIILN